MDDLVFHRMVPVTRLRVTGSDAATFLQGQFTNDLRRAEPRPATYGLWLNHKGRALADSTVLQRGTNDFEVVGLTSPAATIRERLETYIIADDVTVEDLTMGAAGVLVLGAIADEAVRELGFELPGRRQYAEVGERLVIPARVDVGHAWFVIADSTSVSRVCDQLSKKGGTEIDRVALDRRRFAAGIPWVPDELGPDDLPMEGGLEHDAISFTKGCYLGQEVMARLHNLGQVRRRLYTVALQSTSVAVGPGAPLFSGAQRVGELRALVSTNDGGGIGLAMLQSHAVQLGAMLSVEPAGPACVRVEHRAEGRAK